MNNVASNLPVPVSSFDIVEKFDDAAIIEIMTGQAIQEYVYSFKQGGQNVEGLTLAGINEAANRRGGIQVEDIQFQETENSWIAIVKAVDTVTASSRCGAFEQTKTIGGKEDPFAFTKAIHKAQRNAIKQLLPVTVIREVLNFYLKNKGKTMPAPVTQKNQPKAVPTAPEPKNDNGAIGPERAEKLVTGCVNKIGEIEYAQIFNSMNFNHSVDTLTQAQADQIKYAVLARAKILDAPPAEGVQWVEECRMLAEEAFDDIFAEVCGEKEHAAATLREWKEVQARCIQQASKLPEPDPEPDHTSDAQPIPSDPDYIGSDEEVAPF